MLAEGTGVMVAKLEEDRTFLEMSSPVFLPPIREVDWEMLITAKSLLL